MRSVTSGAVLGLVMAALVSPMGASAGGKELKDDKVVPLTRTGVLPVDLVVGPIHLHELLVQDAPSDPEQILALPADKLIQPQASLVIANRADAEVRVRFTVTFRDALARAVIGCTREGQLDELTENELWQVCVRGAAHRVSPAEWAGVKTVRVEVTAAQR